MKSTQIAAVLGAAVLLAGAIAPVSAQDSKDRTKVTTSSSAA
ncbi:MAG TPA: hypothetical protein VJ800_14140 [Pseudolabrys sp.]|nr:hypothetical protein [Pseudolabrys sp.]